MSTENISAAKESVQQSIVREGRSLPLDKRKQSAVIGHLFNPESKMFSYLIGVCDKSWWGDPMHAVIWQAIEAWHREYNRCPRLEELQMSSGLMVRDKDEVRRIQGLLTNCRADALVFTAEPLRKEIQTWMHAKILQNCYTKGAHLWNSEKFDESGEVISDTLKQLNATRWLDTYERRVTDIEEIAEDMGPKGVVFFGIDGIDQHLFPESKEGSLRKGDQTVIMAPVNMGKTTTLITVAVHNIRAGKDVLFVSHEGHRSDLRLKMIRCYLTLMDEVELQKCLPLLIPEYAEKVRNEGGKCVEQLRKIAALKLIDLVRYITKPRDESKSPTNATFAIFNAVLAQMQKHLTFMPIHKAGMVVEEVTIHIDRAQEVWKDSHVDALGNPKGYDLFVCDYPGVLTTRRNDKGQLQWRHQQQIVYDTFVQLALQYEWHSLVAIQTNRDGSKINAGIMKYGEKRFLANEDVAECWGAIMSATTVITVNRPPTAQLGGRVSFLISKSRSSAVGYAATCYSNFAQGVSHANELGFCSYYGSSEMQGVIDNYMHPGERRFVTQGEAAVAVAKGSMEVTDAEKGS